MTFNIDFSYSLGKPHAQADFRSEVDDFIVEENLDVEFSGEGEHLYVEICKRGENTGWVAEKLAQYFDLKTMDVGYAGLKDRHAKTTQWFSLYLPKWRKAVDWDDFVVFSESNIVVLNSTWHKQKLRRGGHSSNRFVIRLRNLTSIEGLPDRLKTISHQGVPNYFGEQRFGRGAGNLELAKKWFEEGEQIRKKKLRGLVMSAARSYLFNVVLEQRVKSNSWFSCIDGDISETPTGPLWGRGRPLVEETLLENENTYLAEYDTWREGLEHCGLDQERRALILKPKAFKWELHEQDVVLSFELAPGAYATSVLREIARLNNKSERLFAVNAG